MIRSPPRRGRTTPSSGGPTPWPSWAASRPIPSKCPWPKPSHWPISPTSYRSTPYPKKLLKVLSCACCVKMCCACGVHCATFNGKNFGWIFTFRYLYVISCCFFCFVLILLCLFPYSPMPGRRICLAGQVKASTPQHTWPAKAYLTSQWTGTAWRWLIIMFFLYILIIWALN